MFPVSTSALNILHTKKLSIPGYLIESPVLYHLGSLYLTFLFSDFFLTGTRSGQEKPWHQNAVHRERNWVCAQPSSECKEKARRVNLYLFLLRICFLFFPGWQANLQAQNWLSHQCVIPMQLSTSLFCFFPVGKLLCVMWLAIKKDSGHPIEVLWLSFFVIFTCIKRPPLTEAKPRVIFCGILFCVKCDPSSL